jgi:LIM domain kinase 1
MAPEIMRGHYFDVSADIFSFGMILCELICKKTMDQEFLERTLPSFGVDEASLRQNAENGCDPKLIELALACTNAVGKDRPEWRSILKRLKEVELRGGVTENIGTIKVDVEEEKPTIFDLFNVSTTSVLSTHPVAQQDTSAESQEGSDKLVISNVSSVQPSTNSINNVSTSTTTTMTSSTSSTRPLAHRFSIVKSYTMLKCGVCQKRFSIIPGFTAHLECDGNCSELN